MSYRNLVYNQSYDDEKFPTLNKIFLAGSDIHSLTKSLMRWELFLDEAENSGVICILRKPAFQACLDQKVRPYETLTEVGLAEMKMGLLCIPGEDYHMEQARGMDLQACIPGHYFANVWVYTIRT